jgi:hypothetical protein
MVKGKRAPKEMSLKHDQVGTISHQAQQELVQSHRRGLPSNSPAVPALDYKLGPSFNISQKVRKESLRWNKWADMVVPSAFLYPAVSSVHLYTVKVNKPSYEINKSVSFHGFPFMTASAICLWSHPPFIGILSVSGELTITTSRVKLELLFLRHVSVVDMWRENKRW